MEHESLSVKQAYYSMFVFMEDRYKRLPVDELGALLGDLSLLADGMPADNAVWGDWLCAVSKGLQACDDDLRLRLE